MCADVCLQVNDETMILLQVAADVGQFLSLSEQALRKHFLTRQYALANALAERFILDAQYTL